MDLTKLSPKERAIRMLIVAGFGTDLDEMDEYILKSILNQFSEEQLLNAFYNVFTPGD